MPYIKPSLRGDIDDCIKLYAYHLKPDGRLNYFLTKLFLTYMRVYGMRYGQAKQFLAELEMAKMEIYRRYVAPYEDEKIKENGDVE